MLEPTFGEFAGLPAVERLAAEAGSWPEAAEDWQWCARFAYQVIERRGTGGGAFRLMYSRFLEEAGRPEAPLAAAAAARWTELARPSTRRARATSRTPASGGEVETAADAAWPRPRSGSGPRYPPRPRRSLERCGSSRPTAGCSASRAK